GDGHRPCEDDFPSGRNREGGHEAGERLGRRRLRQRVSFSGPRAALERRGTAPRRTTRSHGAHDGAHDHGRPRADRDDLRDDGGRRTGRLEGRCKGICSGEESRVPGRAGHRPSVAFVVRVMATGVFDLLHPGHVYFLREARKLGDELWVVVARDSTARKFKHEPIMPESALSPTKAKRLKRIGIVDTSFSRYDMASAAIDELRKQGGGFTVERYTVPGIKDLAAGARILFDRGCELVLALGMVGRQPVDKD